MISADSIGLENALWLCVLFSHYGSVQCCCVNGLGLLARRFCCFCVHPLSAFDRLSSHSYQYVFVFVICAAQAVDRAAIRDVTTRFILPLFNTTTSFAVAVALPTKALSPFTADFAAITGGAVLESVSLDALSSVVAAAAAAAEEEEGNEGETGEETGEGEATEEE